MASESLARHAKTRLALVREEIGLSQAKLAEKTGIPIHKIRYAETGDDKISREIAGAVSETFGYSSLWLLTGEGPKRRGEREDSGDRGGAGVAGAQVEPEALGKVIALVEDGVSRRGVTVTTAEKGHICAAVYLIYVSEQHADDDAREAAARAAVEGILWLKYPPPRQKGQALF